MSYSNYLMTIKYGFNTLLWGKEIWIEICGCIMLTFLFCFITYKGRWIYINKNQDSKFENLVNENITAEVVLVIDENGQQLGEKSLDEALDLAEEAGYDLVCVAPNAKVPVCKFMDYRKVRYEQ